MDWPAARDLHRRASDALIAAAERIPRDAWLTPRAEGKWSPAHILAHLNLTYDVLLRELDGGEGMAIVTKGWQRLLLRFMMVPKIRRGSGFPQNARAPREVRPPAPAEDQDAAIAAFRERTARFAAAAEAAHARRGRLTHAYFGSAGIPDGSILCSRHIEHHTAQLEALAHADA